MGRGTVEVERSIFLIFILLAPTADFANFLFCCLVVEACSKLAKLATFKSPDSPVRNLTSSYADMTLCSLFQFIFLCNSLIF
jgi:hypothetical protein